MRQLIRELPTERDRQLLLRFYVTEEDKESLCADLGLDSLHFNRVLSGPGSASRPSRSTARRFTFRVLK